MSHNGDELSHNGDELSHHRDKLSHDGDELSHDGDALAKYFGHLGGTRLVASARIPLRRKILSMRRQYILVASAPQDWSLRQGYRFGDKYFGRVAEIVWTRRRCFGRLGGTDMFTSDHYMCFML